MYEMYFIIDNKERKQQIDLVVYGSTIIMQNKNKENVSNITCSVKRNHLLDCLAKWSQSINNRSYWMAGNVRHEISSETRENP